MNAPRTVGRFEVVEALADGSLGSVLEGRDPNGGQAVRIQLCTLEDPELRRRFHAEATAVAKLRHPHVIEVRGVGFEGEVPYLVEESQPRHLGQILEQRPPWSAGEKLALLQQVGRGLAYGHSRGLQHLELRPDQIRLANVEGRHVAKVAGFGVARLANDVARKGVTLETAVYLPPEQIRGGAVDHRVDLFALGVIAYELLTYERPFRGQNLSALVYQILYKEPQAMVAAWPDCPSSLEQILARCLAKKPEERYDSVEAMLADIDTFLRQAHGRWAGLEKPYQAMPSVTRDVSDTEVTRSQLARTAKDLGPRGSEGAATVRLAIDPEAVAGFESELQATQSLPALGDEASAEERASEEASRPGESTITLPSPPEPIPPAELGGPVSSPPTSATPSGATTAAPPEAPSSKTEPPKKPGVDTRPVGRKTVRLDAIPVVTPNRPVPPSEASPAPPAPPVPPTPGGALPTEPGDELPTVVSAREGAGPLAPSRGEEPEEPTLVTSDELPTVLSSTPLSGMAKPPEEPTRVTSDELPTVLSSTPLSEVAEPPEEPTLVTSDELPTVLSSTPLSESAEPPPEEPTRVTSDELPTVLSSSPLSDLAEDLEEPTLVTASDELPTMPSSQPPAAAPPPPSAAAAETGPEPTLVVPVVPDPAPSASSGVTESSSGSPEPTLVVPTVPEPGPSSPATGEAPAFPQSVEPVAERPQPSDLPLPQASEAPSDLGFTAPEQPTASTSWPSGISPPSEAPPSATPAPSAPPLPSATTLPSVPNQPRAAAGSTGASAMAFESPTAPQDPGGVVLTQGPTAPQPPAPQTKKSGKWLWVALAGVALLAMLAFAGLAWWWFQGRGAEEGPDDAGAVVATPAPPPPIAADTPLGQVVVLAAPWGRLVEITDAAGFVQELPDAPFTPLSLALPPGRYRITLQYGDDPGLPIGAEGGGDGDSDTGDGVAGQASGTDEGSAAGGPDTETVASGEPAVCEIEVRLDTVARCQVRFEAPSATDYFKEAGWWQ